MKVSEKKGGVIYGKISKTTRNEVINNEKKQAKTAHAVQKWFS